MDADEIRATVSRLRATQPDREGRLPATFVRDFSALAEEAAAMVTQRRLELEQNQRRTGVTPRSYTRLTADEMKQLEALDCGPENTVWNAMLMFMGMCDGFAKCMGKWVKLGHYDESKFERWVSCYDDDYTPPGWQSPTEP